MKKIFTICLLAFLGTTQLNAQCSISLLATQSTTSNIGTSTPVKIMQSFIAPCSGNLQSFTVHMMSVTGGVSGVALVTTGDYNGYSVIHASTGQNIVAGLNTYTLPFPLTLTAGSTYSIGFIFTGSNSSVRFYAKSNANLYAGGTHWLTISSSTNTGIKLGDSDLSFEVNIAAACTPTSSTTNLSICQSQLPYTWNGLTFNTAGSQTATLTNAAGCDSAATLNLTIKAGALANINATTGATASTIGLCNIGDEIQITNYTAPNGTWTSSNNSIVTATPVAGTYNRTVTLKAIATGTATVTYSGINTSGGCPASISTVVNIQAQAAPSAIVGSSTACVGVSNTYSSTPGGGVWAGLIGAFSGNVFTPTSAGTTTITYTLTNAAGCSASVTKVITIGASPATPTIAFAAGTTGVSGSGGYCKNKTFTLVGNPANGVWSKTGVIAMSPTGTPSTNTVVNTGNTAGAFSVSYTVANASGCTSIRTIPSNVVTCGPRGVNAQLAISNEQLVVYPNPARYTINLNVKTLVGAGSIVVTDLYGKTVKQQTLSMGTNTIDVSTFTKGMYLVSVITQEGKQTQKVIVE